MENYSFAQLAFLVLVFAVVAGIPLTAYFLLRRTAVQRRLDQVFAPASVEGVEQRSAEAPKWMETIVQAVTPLAKLSLPDEGWENSELRRRFIQAGWRNPNAPIIFFAIKTVAAFGLPLVLWLSRVFFGSTIPLDDFLLYVGLIACVSFYMPNLVLNNLIAKRKLEIFESFPDALDLLTICVEAGLSLEAALNRVAAEISLKSEILAEELQLVCLEFRAGSGKERALRNLALRTGVDDIDTLVAMLIQSEKFGTSIGESLRIHSEGLRVKRQQRAEENAAKVSVKLTFPLVLCIFPSIMIVVVGPAVISIMRNFAKFTGGG